MRKALCAQDISELLAKGEKSLYVTKDMILTPSAKDMATENNINLVYGEPCHCEPCCEPARKEGISEELIFKALTILAEQGMLEEVIKDGTINIPK